MTKPTLLPLALLLFLLIPFFTGCSAEKKNEVTVAIVDTPADLKLLGESFSLAMEMFPDIRIGNAPAELNLIRIPIHGSAAEAIQGFHTAVSDYKADVVVGYSSPYMVPTIANVAEELGIPFLSPSVGPAYQHQRFTFLTRPSLSYSAEAMAHFFLHELKIGKLGIIFDIEDSFSADVASAVHHYYSFMGGHTIKVLPYKEGVMLDQRLKEMAAFEPDLIFLASRRPEMYNHARRLQNLGYTGALFSPNPHDAFSLEQAAPSLDPIAVYFMFYWNPNDDNELNLHFKKLAEARGVPLSVDLAMGFDTALRLVNALKKSKSARPADIQKALAGMRGMNGVSGRFFFSESYATQTRKTCWFYKLQDGELRKIFSLTPQTAHAN